MFQFLRNLFFPKRKNPIVSDSLFINKTSYFKLTRASIIANDLIKNSQGFYDLMNGADFKYENNAYAGEDILALLRSPFSNYIYKRYWNPFSKVISHEENGRIYFNTKFLNLSINKIAANLVHERLHSLGFTHKSAKDYDSIPYKIGGIVYNFLEENDSR